MQSLKSNLVKRIDRLPKPRNATAALQPLFEAVSNGIHSTQAKFGVRVGKEGQITVNINITRSKDDPKITVQDNGVGLDEKNYEAFITTDTDNKLPIGGKGVGRLLWLDCFEKIRVTSAYDAGETRRQRAFDFVLSNQEQIKKYEDRRISGSEPTGFFVSFYGLRDNGYLDKFPGRGEYILQHFTSHFLPAFVSKRCPTLTVICGDETRIFPSALDDIVFRRSPELQIDSDAFGSLRLSMLECSKIASADLKGSNFVHFIAHDRTVVSQSIDGKLGLKQYGELKDRVFHAVLSGRFLDKSVNQERTGFVFEDALLDSIINDQCWEHIANFLSEQIEDLKSRQRAQIKAITDSYPSVAYGSLEELQKKVPSGELNGDAIYSHLSRERFRRDERQGEKLKGIMRRLKSEGMTTKSLRDAIQEARVAVEDAEQKSLTEYVVKRKVVLDFMDLLLVRVGQKQQDASYQREDILHSFICPLKVGTLPGGKCKVEAATSHELWIVDERLAFARYFSSDLDFGSFLERPQSKDRPDLLIFDHVHGLRQAEDTSKILLVEFKRPGRKDYKDDENPQMQVERYVRQLLAGTMPDLDGRPIKLNPSTIFYCYIVADIVGRMDDWTYTWPRTADGRGRFLQPQSGFRGIIEVISWDALLHDARMRNRAFFDRAGISGHNIFKSIEAE